MNNILQLLISGVSMGFIYALVAIEYTLIWNATSLLNFSHDKFIMLSAYAFAGTYVAGIGLPYALSVVLTLVTMFLFGIVVALFIFNPLSKLASNLYAIIGTVILGRIITEAIRLIWGPIPFTLDDFLKGTISVGDQVVSRPYIYIVIVCMIITFALTLFLKKSKIGMAMRCVSNNKNAAGLMGINVPLNLALTVGISASICTVIGILIIPLFNVHSTMSSMIGLKGFSAGVVGGFGYLPGAILGGLLIGLVENFGSMILPSVYKDVVSFGLLILFLLFRPSGILGHKKT
ncbi:branched-chain amino acid ABC transporter permease [Bacillota bacterium Meth-B3]|nr:branched-chain amino acid ABC transporter permease [Christensenellaceae bacterium]